MIIVKIDEKFYEVGVKKFRVVMTALHNGEIIVPLPDVWQVVKGYLKGDPSTASQLGQEYVPEADEADSDWVKKLGYVDFDQMGERYGNVTSLDDLKNIEPIVVGDYYKKHLELI